MKRRQQMQEYFKVNLLSFDPHQLLLKQLHNPLRQRVPTNKLYPCELPQLNWLSVLFVDSPEQFFKIGDLGLIVRDDLTGGGGLDALEVVVPWTGGLLTGGIGVGSWFAGAHLLTVCKRLCGYLLLQNR